MILNLPPAIVIQQLWEMWLSCDKRSLKCHSSAGIESGTWVKSLYCPILLFFFLALQKKRSKAGTQPPQILRLLGQKCGQSRIRYSHFRLDVIAKQAALATRIIFRQARVVQHAWRSSAPVLWVSLSPQTPHQIRKRIRELLIWVS